MVYKWNRKLYYIGFCLALENLLNILVEADLYLICGLDSYVDK